MAYGKPSSIVALVSKTANNNILDIGCGRRKIPEAVGMDNNPRSEADVIHNLDAFPYPFPDNRFDLVIGRYVISNVDNPVRVIEELHRITRPGGLIRLIIPHFTAVHSWADDTHRHYFSYTAFNGCFDEKGKASFYTDKRFRVRTWLDFPRFWRWLGVEIMANRWPALYEKTFLRSLFPARDLHVELEVLK